MRKATKTFFLIIFIWLALSTFSIVNAASADIKAEPTSVNIGEKATVTVTVNAATCNLTVAGSAKDKIVEVNLKGENEKHTKTYTIDTSKAGTYTVSLTGDVTDGKTDENTKINKSVSITVKEKTSNSGSSNNNAGSNTTGSNTGTTNNNSSGNNTTTNNNSGTTTEKPKEKSTNAYLSTLGVTPKEYDFSNFKKTTLSYNVTIPYEVDSLKVLYKTADSNATVKVTGNSDFVVGSNNKITIKVTAEDGKTTKTYTIKVTKLAKEEEKPGNVIEETKGENICLTSLSIKDVNISPEFSKDVYAYTAVLSKNITEVEVKAEANKENAIIEISGNTNLYVGENTINVVVKEEGSTEQLVYQINLTKEAVLVTTEENESDFMSNLIDNIKNYVIIAIAVVVLIIATIIILIVLLVKENKKIKKEQTQEEYKVYENDKKEIEETIEEVKKEEVTNETETKNERRTRRKEKGRHSR